MVVALGPGRFYGSSLPRPRYYTDVKLNDDGVRIDPPVSVLDPLLSWANDAHWSMGGLSFKRCRLQGRIEGSIKRLRAQEERKEKKRKRLAKRPSKKMELQRTDRMRRLALQAEEEEEAAYSSSESEEEKEADVPLESESEDEGEGRKAPEEEEDGLPLSSLPRKRRARNLKDEFERVASAPSVSHRTPERVRPSSKKGRVESESPKTAAETSPTRRGKAKKMEPVVSLRRSSRVSPRKSPSVSI